MYCLVGVVKTFVVEIFQMYSFVGLDAYPVWNGKPAQNVVMVKIYWTFITFLYVYSLKHFFSIIYPFLAMHLSLITIQFQFKKFFFS